tara:strand:- start:3217 stop:4236 length:1020 start_codon:yes stop_codon:yes gene_type:complete
MAAVLDQISIATLAMHGDLNQAVLSRNSAALRIMQDGAQRKTGSPIKVKVRHKRNNGGWYKGFDTFDTTRVEQFAEGQLQWANVYVNVTIDESSLVENASMNIKDLMGVSDIKRLPSRDRATIFNLFGEEMAGALDDMQDKLGNSLYSDGTSNQMDGFANLVDSTGTYAGIAYNELGAFGYNGFLSGGADNIWAAKEKGTVGAITLDVLADALNDANQGGADAIDCVFCPLDIYSSIELQLEGQKTRPNENMAAIGFRQNIEWVSQGCTFYPDPFCTAGTVYGINKNHTKLYLHPGLDMEFSGFKEPTDQAAITGQLKTKIQLYCDDRAKNFKLTGVTA